MFCAFEMHIVELLDCLVCFHEIAVIVSLAVNAVPSLLDTLVVLAAPFHVCLLYCAFKRLLLRIILCPT